LVQLERQRSLEVAGVQFVTEGAEGFVRGSEVVDQLPPLIGAPVRRQQPLRPRQILRGLAVAGPFAPLDKPVGGAAVETDRLIRQVRFGGLGDANVDGRRSRLG